MNRSSAAGGADLASAQSTVSAILPPLSSATRSATASAESMSWVITIEVTPRRFCSEPISSLMRRALVGIEPGGRLVVEDDLGPRRQRARQTDALLHAARQIGGPHRLDPRQADPLETLGDARAHSLVGPAIVLVAGRRPRSRRPTSSRRAPRPETASPPCGAPRAAAARPAARRRRRRRGCARRRACKSPMISLSSTLLPTPDGPSTVSVSPFCTSRSRASKMRLSPNALFTPRSCSATDERMDRDPKGGAPVQSILRGAPLRRGPLELGSGSRRGHGDDRS